MFNTPKFWFEGRFILSTLLLPFSALYWILSKIRNLHITPKVLEGKIVICIGNVTMGGSGKTPLAIAICNALKQHHSVCFLSKGYGRKTRGFLVASKNCTANDIGDEPKILLQHAPVYLCSKYSEVVKNYNQIQEQIIIMDDGLQNPAIAKNCTILLIDHRGFGNGKLFPSGPMRESLNLALSKADCVIGYKNSFPSQLPYFQIHLQYYTNVAPQRVIAFSGLGNNAKFKESLQSYGFNVVHFFAFPDHHTYSEKDLSTIIHKANKLSVIVITTEKDFVKLSNQHQKMVSIFYIKCILPHNFNQSLTDILNKNRTF